MMGAKFERIKHVDVGLQVDCWGLLQYIQDCCAHLSDLQSANIPYTDTEVGGTSLA